LATKSTIDWVALIPGKALQEKVAKAIEDEGYFVIRARIGGN
jgi:hypothetical protein